jgi:hypothetical protein
VTHLGLDLGTGFAKVARSTPGEPARPGAAPALTTVPAALVYGDRGAEIPLDYAAGTHAGAVRCDGFPALLGTPDSGRQVASWESRTPTEVTGSYLERLLQRSASDADEGRADALVATVPATEVARQFEAILAVQDNAPGRVVAAPVAALLWLRQCHPDLATASRIVVIDAGAGAIDLSLCTANGDEVRVADSMRLIGQEAWLGENPADALVGDRPPTLAECLAAAVASAAGPRFGRDGRTPVYWWRAFERVLADERSRDQLDTAVQLASEARQQHGSVTALRFGGLEVTADQLMNACEPVSLPTVAALGRLLDRQADPGWSAFGSGTATRLVLVGGLNALLPLRSAFLTGVGLDPDHPDGVVVPGNDDLLGAAARGAALIAAGRADPGDRFPCALRLVLHRIVRDQVVTEDLLLAAPGTISLQTTETTYLTVAAREHGHDTSENDAVGRGAGDDILVTVRPAASGEPSPVPIPVQLVAPGALPLPAAFKPAPPPPPGVYRVGVSGGPDGPAVVLRPANGGPPLTFPLAERQERRDTDHAHIGA